MQTRFSDVFPPKPGRAHEVTGAGAIAFAAMACGLSGKPIIWLSENWASEVLNPSGLTPFCDPRLMLLGCCTSSVDLMACAEEALRSGAVPMVIAEISKPLTLIAGRRLQLAAKAGNATGIFIIPDGMGSNAAETRWQCSPIFDAEDSTLQRWELIKNKSGTLGNWKVRWNADARRVTVVSQNAERPHSARSLR